MTQAAADISSAQRSAERVPTSMRDRARAWLSRPIVQDALIAGVLTATSLVGVATHLHVDLPEGAGDTTLHTLDALGITLVLLQTAPLVWRRTAPVLVLAVITGALFLFSLDGYFRSFASFGFLIALYTVAAHRERRISVPAGIVSGILVFLVFLFGRESIEPDAVIAESLIVAASWFIGDGYRIRRGQYAQLEERAARLERAGEELARHAVAEERRVIARELHDVVAHNVTVMVAEAGAARVISDTHPDEALATLEPIERTGREALVEMRRLMGFLRPGSDHLASHSPQPGLADLDTLADQARHAGLRIGLRVEGTPRPMSPGFDLSAFRIVQEALTNSIKHADAESVQIVVRYEDRRLVLIVDDDGIGPGSALGDPSRPRYGHLGMRERVGLFGGDLHVGARSGGGYRVMASLPFDTEAT